MLFHRLPRGVKVTDAGAEFAESARVIMRELDTARARVDCPRAALHRLTGCCR